MTSCEMLKKQNLLKLFSRVLALVKIKKRIPRFKNANFTKIIFDCDVIVVSGNP